MIAESFEVTRKCKCIDQSSQAKRKQHKAKEIHSETVTTAANASNFWHLAGGKEKHTQTMKEDSSLHRQKNGITEFITGERARSTGHVLQTLKGKSCELQT